jgi:hypothetical protein
VICGIEYLRNCCGFTNCGLVKKSLLFLPKGKKNHDTAWCLAYVPVAMEPSIKLKRGILFNWVSNQDPGSEMGNKSRSGYGTRIRYEHPGS